MQKRYLLLFAVMLTINSKSQAEITPTNEGDSASYYLIKAKEFKDARKNWEAEKSFQKALAFNPDNENARLDLAAYYCEQRKYFPATEQYKKVLAKNSNNAIALQRMMDISFLMRKWEDVITYGSQLNEKNIKADKLNFMLGKAYYETENYGKAKATLTAQLALTPDNNEIISLLGRVYVEAGNYNEAITMYTKSLAVNPNNPDLLYEMGLLYSAQHNEREAVKYFEQSAEKGYKQDIAYLENLGTSYLEFDIKKGVEVLNKVLDKKPGDVEILTQIAQTYYKMEDFATSYDYYYKIYQADNSNMRALYMSGVALIKKGDKTKGGQICDHAIAMDPQLAGLRSTKSKF